MEYKRALYIYNIDSTIGLKEEHLKKLKRKLVKENHPDSATSIQFSIDEINTAYEMLLNSIQGRSSVKAENIYTKSSRKELKELLLDELLDYLRRDRATLKELAENYNIFIKIKNEIKIFNTISNNLDVTIKESRVAYVPNSRLNVVIEVDYQLGDKGELVINDTKHVGLNLSNARNLLMIEYPISEYLNLGMNYTITGVKDEEYR